MQNRPIAIQTMDGIIPLDKIRAIFTRKFSTPKWVEETEIDTCTYYVEVAYGSEPGGDDNSSVILHKTEALDTHNDYLDWLYSFWNIKTYGLNDKAEIIKQDEFEKRLLETVLPYNQGMSLRDIEQTIINFNHSTIQALLDKWVKRGLVEALDDGTYRLEIPF